MSEKNENRWWENYLVRYLVPSIAGMFILMWLNKNAGCKLEEYLPMLAFEKSKDFNTANLVCWLLFGTLYCYIASYPILVFHAVRVKFFIKKALLFFMILVFIFILTFVSILTGLHSYLTKESQLIFGLVVGFILLSFSIFQIIVLYKTINSEGYSYTAHLTNAKNPDPEYSVKNSSYIKDITDSYKHLREHGNTALIVLLEIFLAFILYFALRIEKENELMDFSLVCITLIIWIIPSALVYFYGHFLERKFSGYQ